MMDATRISGMGCSRRGSSMKVSRVVSLLVSVLMIASLLYVAGGSVGFDGSIVPSSIEEHLEDGDGDGKANFLVVTVPVHIYEVVLWESARVYGELYDSSGTFLIDTCLVDLDVEEGDSGLMYADLTFSGRAINASGIDGPYLVEVELQYDDGWAWPPIYSVYDSASYDTATYAHDEFETPDPYTITDMSWDVVDDDDDGLFDWLRVNITVDADDGDDLVCQTSWGTYATTETEHAVEAGADQTVTVLLDGRLVNGFALEDYAWSVNVDLSTSDGYTESDGISTDPISSSDFEEYPVRIVDDIGWETVDVNDDGLTDFVKLQYNVTVGATAKYRIGAEVENDNGTTLTWPDNFEGFLIADYEETIITFVDGADIYESRDGGPYHITVTEQPGAYNLWSDYTYIHGVDLGWLTIDTLDVDDMNHPMSLQVAGFVLDDTETPIDGAYVEAESYDLDWMWDGYDDGMTPGDGSYELTGLVPGYLRIVASAADCFPQILVVEDFHENLTDLNITLESMGPENSTIVGTVTDLEGDPVSGASVVLMRAGSGMFNGTYTDSEGNYSIDVKPGDYTLFAVYSDPYTGDVNLSYAPVTATPDETVEQNLTMDMTISGDVEMSASGLIELTLNDWNNANMNWRVDFAPETTEMFTEFFLMLDIEYGNADGFLDPAEADFFMAEFFGGDLSMTSGMYSLDMFSVDGIGYFVPPGGVEMTVSDVTGPVLNERDDLSFNVAFSDGYAYWTIADADTHDLYVEVEYNSAEGDSIDLVFEVAAPAGYVLTGTNDPVNVDVDGVSRVVVTPGESPDPDEVESALVVLTFARETSVDTGAIHGVATLEDDTDHSGIQVDLMDDDLTVLDSATTGPTGEFAFPNLEPGEYQLRANMSGYVDAYASATVVAGEVIDVEMELAAVSPVPELGSISATVVTEAGLPIAGAVVDLYLPSDSTTVLESRETGAAGTFVFTDLEAGEYRLEVSADDFDDTTVYVLMNSGEDKVLVDIVLESESPVGYITGVLEDADGDPIEDVLVEVRLSGSDDVLGDDETGSDGVFLVEGLEDGDYNLTFLLDGEVIGYADVTVEDFVGDAGTIVIDLGSVGDETELPSWLWMAVILALVVAVVAAVALKMRGRAPKEPKSMQMAQQAPEEELPPPPPE